MRLSALWAGLVCAGLPLVAAGETAIGVAPFERIAGEGQGVPDVATRLAQRLSTKGIEKVVGPADLGAPALAEPAAHEVAGWASRAGVGFVVVGRTTRLGNTVSVDARLLEAVTGRELGTRLVEEANRPEDLGRAIEGLATQVVERLGVEGAAAAASETPAPKTASRARPRRFSKDSPISIKSNELEALDRAGERNFVFTGAVRAVQADLVVNSDRLEAFYPPGASQPERLVATGNVVLIQSGRTAYCRTATYYREDQRLVCTGDAILEQGCDRVAGEQIIFFLDTETLKVTGSADVKLRPDEPGCATKTAARSEP